MTEKQAGYVVLARRFRPTQFEEVIGQQHVSRTLQNAIRAGRVHHAYLFTGSRGIGKTTVARILARALNHPDGPTPTPPPIAPEQESSVDVIEIDGASHTGVDDVRELRESVRYLPSNSRYKIYIIDEVHMLSTSAFNALLKTLEEPPPHVIFVFATTEPHKIPATILSRCQRFDFKRVPTPVLVEHLEHLLRAEKLEVERDGLSMIARAAEGGVRDSLSLLDQVIAYAAGQEGPITSAQVAEVLGVADRRSLFELSGAVIDRDAAASLAVVDRVFRDGLDLAQFARAFASHLRDLVVVASCEDPGPLVDTTETELNDLRAQTKQAGLALLQQHFDRFVQAADEIARSTFARLLLEMVLIEMAHAEPLLPLGDLLERLEALETRLQRGGGSPAPPSSGGGRGPERKKERNERFSPPGETPRAKPAGASAPPSVSSPAPTQAASTTRPSPSASPGRGVKAAPLEFAIPASVMAGGEEGVAPPPESENPEPEEPHISAEAEADADRGAQPERQSAAPSDEAPAQPEGQSAAKSENAAARVGGNGVSLLAQGPPLERWQKLVEEVGGPLAATFATGRLVRWEANSVELGYDPQSFELPRAESRDRQSEFAGQCAVLLGEPLEISVRALTDQELDSPELAQISALEANERQQAERVESLREEAKQHPITRSLVEDFGARITTIKTEADG